MKYELRKRKILSEIASKDIVDVLEIAGKLEVSPITIRRDLDRLSAQGLLIRTHGGAAKKSNTPIISFDAKRIQNARAKKYICRQAASLIKDGDTIFIDCGSTTFGLCDFIKDKEIRVITNSLPVFNALIFSNIELNLVGGTYDRKRLAIHGNMAAEHIKKYQADKAFIGIDGVSIDGLSSNTENESSITKSMIDNSKESILLCDESKIGKNAYYTFAEISSITSIISDQRNEYMSHIEKQNPSLQILT